MIDMNDLESKFFAIEIGAECCEIDLHGADDVYSGVNELDEFLNQAFTRGEEVVKVVHGKGQGKMREGVLELLKSLPFVEYFRDATNPSNALGVTLVALSQKQN